MGQDPVGVHLKTEIVQFSSSNGCKARGAGVFDLNANTNDRSQFGSLLLNIPTSTPLNGGSLGSGDDEERSEMRYVM